MAGSDTLTGKKVKETYTKLLQLNSDNELLDGVGGQVAPILKAGATVEGALNVQGTIYRNGVEVGTSTGDYWSENAEGEVYRSSNVGIGINNPEAKVHIASDSSTEDFFIVKKQTMVGDTLYEKDVFKVTNEGTMVLGSNENAPEVEKGAMYYNSNEDEFYLGFDN